MIADQASRNQLGRLATRVHVQALVTANLLTAIAWIWKSGGAGR
jgi:hypothetical protein